MSEPWIIGPQDPRHAALLRKRFNRRFEGRPDVFYLPGSPGEVALALDRALAEGQHLAAQSGGHGLEGFVSDPSVKAVIDTSRLTSVAFDPAMGTIAIDAGLTLGEAQRRLFLAWGVMLPAGQSPDIGVGGHVLGGAFGFFHRRHGMAVDHLHAVELVHVDAAGRARLVTATREDTGELGDLFWAHTGCGGGNYGIVTRYHFRTPGASSALPPAPSSVTTAKWTFGWDGLSKDDVVGLLARFGGWCEGHAEPGIDEARLFAVLTTGRPGGAPLHVRAVVIDEAGQRGPSAETLLDAFAASLTRGVRAESEHERATMAWLDFVLDPLPDLFATKPLGVLGGGARTKVKDALLVRRHTDAQLAVIHEHLTANEPHLPGGSVGLATYGGRVRGPAEDATAYAQRSAVMDTSYGVGWASKDDDARCLSWARALYRDVFAASGGVPVPSDATEGALINHPDVDLADPAHNRSGVPWSTLYYKGNYPRLQRVKRQWDPRDVFHHALSIRR